MDRTEAIRRDAEEREEYTAVGFIKDAESLAKVGIIGEYRADAGENGAPKDHLLHIIPPHPKDGQAICLKLHVHWNVDGLGSSVLCPRWMQKVIDKYNREYGAEIAMPEPWQEGRCPICEYLDQLNEQLRRMRAKNPTGDFGDILSQIGGLKPYSGYKLKRPNRVLLFVRNASSSEAEKEGTYVYVAPPSVYDRIVEELCYSRLTGYFDITDPKDGKIVAFCREGTGREDTKYTKFEAIPRDPIPDEWLDVPRFLDVLNVVDYDFIAKLFSARGLATYDEGVSAEPERTEESRREDVSDVHARATRQEDVGRRDTGRSIEGVRQRIRAENEVRQEQNESAGGDDILNRVRQRVSHYRENRQR